MGGTNTSITLKPVKCVQAHTLDVDVFEYNTQPCVDQPFNVTFQKRHTGAAPHLAADALYGMVMRMGVVVLDTDTSDPPADSVKDTKAVVAGEPSAYAYGLVVNWVNAASITLGAADRLPANTSESKLDGKPTPPDELPGAAKLALARLSAVLRCADTAIRAVCTTTGCWPGNTPTSPPWARLAAKLAVPDA